jgi:hypothetical protein
MNISIGSERWAELLCDFCGAKFVAQFCEEDIVSDLPRALAVAAFDPKTAGAVCPGCAEVLRRLFDRRLRSRRDKALYQQFVARCAESVARKLGLVPISN